MKKSVYIIICLWLMIIAGFVLSQEFTLHTGKEILLKTVPVDPRDLLRGDYVILNYEIAQLPNDNKLHYNQTVYVILDTDNNKVARVKNIVEERPSDELYLKGKTDRCHTFVPFLRTSKCVTFGIESYFVKEGTGRALEKDLRNGALVKVIVDRNGRAKVKGFVK